jgi:4-diphosphocytidyl-2-C-methyl-D-erythritol kinase
VVTPVKLGRPLDFVLVCPPVGLSTAAVYREVTIPKQPVDGTPLLRAVADGELEAIGQGLFNRLQEPAERLCPPVQHWLDRLQTLGPAGQRMSGSGSSLFGLCRNRSEAERIAGALTQESGAKSQEFGPGVPRVFIVRSCA